MAASVLLHHQIEKPFEPAPFRLAVFICGSLPYSFGSDLGVDVARLFAAPPPTGFGPPNYITYEPRKDDGSATARPLFESQPNLKANGLSQISPVGFNMSTMNEQQWAQIPVAPGTDFEPDSNSETEDSALFSNPESRGSSTPLTSDYDSDLDSSDEHKVGPFGGPVDHVVRRFHPTVDKLRINIPTAHIYGRLDPYYRQSMELAKLCDQQWASAFEHPQGHLVPRDKGINEKIAVTIGKAIQMCDICSL